MSVNLTSRELLILGAVHFLGETGYGTSIRSTIAEKTGQNLAFATLYTALDRLEKNNFIESRIAEPTAKRGGRRKKLYRITGLGAERFDRALDDLNCLRGKAIGATP